MVNLENIQRNLIREIKEEVPGIIIGFKTMGLGSIVGTIFRGLSELALKNDPKFVASIASQTCNIAMGACVIIGGIAFVYLLHKQEKEKKLPVYVKIQEKDFAEMNNEILKLRQLNEILLNR